MISYLVSVQGLLISSHFSTSDFHTASSHLIQWCDDQRFWTLSLLSTLSPLKSLLFFLKSYPLMHNLWVECTLISWCSLTDLYIYCEYDRCDRQIQRLQYLQTVKNWGIVFITTCVWHIIADVKWSVICSDLSVINVLRITGTVLNIIERHSFWISTVEITRWQSQNEHMLSYHHSL